MTAPRVNINIAALTFYDFSEPPGPNCFCSFCRLPIGASDDDPRWDSHNEDACNGCDVCETPIRLWGVPAGGKEVLEARLHHACLQALMQEGQIGA